MPELSDDEQIERIYTHLKGKYGKDGYIKIYLEDDELEESLKKLREALEDKNEFIERIKTVISNEQ